MTLFIILLLSLILLATFHMIAPDHWVPVSLVSSVRKFSNIKKFSFSILIGALHAFTSVLVALLALAIGLLLIRSFLSYLYDAGVVLLVLVGVYFLINGLRESKEESKLESFTMQSVLVISVFPDFALVPIIISSVPLSIIQIITLLIVFVIVSSFSLALIVFASSFGIAGALKNLKPSYLDYLIGAILFITAAILRFI
jgi:putative Mn2+ efflux pump MntP